MGDPDTESFTMLLFHFGAVIVCILFSAFISASEVAFFSLKRSDIEAIKERSKRTGKGLERLLANSKQLLATILIANNLANIAVVLILFQISSALFNFTQYPIGGGIVNVLGITFILLLFGEIIPKLYANAHPRRVVLRSLQPMKWLMLLFYPISQVLTSLSALIDPRLSSGKGSISFDDISQAIKITDTPEDADREILESIVSFRSKSVGDIMRSRQQVVALDSEKKLSEVVAIILSSSFSRLPVYEKDFDNIVGILYIKDLLSHFGDDDTFQWRQLARPPYFVPESKMINNLLHEFQGNKVHMAIVIDEYGGTSGIVTLEDVLEEIVGEISDESDNEERFYAEEGEGKYLFKAETLIVDFCKLMRIEEDYFDDFPGDADTLAGLVLELNGDMPAPKDHFIFNDFVFTVAEVNNKRIEKILVESKRVIDE